MCVHDRLCICACVCKCACMYKCACVCVCPQNHSRGMQWQCCCEGQSCLCHKAVCCCYCVACVGACEDRVGSLLRQATGSLFLEGLSMMEEVEACTVVYYERTKKRVFLLAFVVVRSEIEKDGCSEQLLRKMK
eukprot:GHVU01225432.1.p1 GENE.GHVU01225432.1~~GHVU01225432.1.p1  ORF type:complete len:133 (+),score=12.62 GHVU01225432.1:253-651(+)